MLLTMVFFVGGWVGGKPKGFIKTRVFRVEGWVCASHRLGRE
jgi:hypothetical protein